MKIEIKNLQKKVRILPEKIKKAIRKTLQSERQFLDSKINVVFVSDIQIRKLNRKFHQKDSSTDVLAFDLGICKDIIISTDTAKKNSRLFNTSVQYELCLYAVHGMLHFLGHKDNTEKKRRLMQARAERILNHVN